MRKRKDHHLLIIVIVAIIGLSLSALFCYNFYLNCKARKMLEKQVEVDNWIIQKINEIETRNE